MNPSIKITKKFGSKVINRQYFYRKTGLKLVFISKTKCIYGLVELLCERDDVISLAFQNAQDMKDGAMDHPPWERPTDSNVPQQP